MLQNMLETCPEFLRHVHEYTHYVKSVHIQSFSGPYFPEFGLNTERYGVSLCIQSKCGKIRTRKTPDMDTFHAVILSSSTEVG